MRKAVATRPAQAMVARREVTTRPCCHDSCDEVNPARTRFTQHVDNVWGANSRRTSTSSNADTFETKRNKSLCGGEIAVVLVAPSEAIHVISDTHHIAASAISL